MVIMIKGFRSIVFIFIVISTTFRPICPPASFRCLLSKFLRRTLIFIIKGLRSIVFIFIVISTTFRPKCPPASFRCLLSKFLRRSLMIFIIKGFRAIVFIFIVISTTFRPIYPPAFFRCLLNSETFTELRTELRTASYTGHSRYYIFFYYSRYVPAIAVLAKPQVVTQGINSFKVI